MTPDAGPAEQHRRVRRLETGWRFLRGDVEDGADPALDDTTGAVKPAGRFHQAAWSDEPTVFAAAHEIRFAVDGAGGVAGVDNGDLDSDEPWVGETRSVYHGTCIAVVQADREGGTVEVAAEAEGIDGDSVTVAVEER